MTPALPCRGGLRAALLLVLLAVSAFAARPLPAAAQPAAADEGERRTALEFERVRDQPVALGMLLRRMPKGGDLHNHLVGAIYAESLIGWGRSDGLCVQLKALALTAPPCAPSAGRPKLAEALEADPLLYRELVDAFSVHDFVAAAGLSSHDHFFDAFARFDAATTAHDADMIAEAADHAAADGVDYLELMWSPNMAAARGLGAPLAWSEDFDRLSAALRPGVGDLVARTRRYIDATEAKARRIMGCGTAQARPGCRVVVRYLAQVIRTFPPAQVFAQSEFGYALAEADPRVVGVNLVAPEDDPISLEDYDRHMRLLGYLGRRHPSVRLSLHAGELALGLAPPGALRFHIREAVEVAGARRIGHGVDLQYEDDAAGLLQEMARRRVMVEINLTSNDLTLGVKGGDHPFQAYRAAGVPVALSSDDEGVSRIDLTHEFARAAATYRLGYLELKTLARNSLEYAFLPGESLWASAAPYRRKPACAGDAGGSSSPSAGCAALLAGSERARLQWRVEGEFRAFEATDWAGRP